MKIKSQIESLLFTAGHPVAVKKLAEILETGESEINSSLRELADEYEKNERGL
ncbi:MAG: Segregation and condensation protein B, partial [Candidatus Giovannonibacteria bacterium GW2011_GWC2_44_8]